MFANLGFDFIAYLLSFMPKGVPDKSVLDEWSNIKGWQTHIRNI